MATYGIGERIRAAMDAYRNPGLAIPKGSKQPIIDQTGRYDFLWDWWSGSWTFPTAQKEMAAKYPELYANTRQLWRQSDAIVSLYEQYVYTGDLPTDGEALPDGSKGAIPIDAQTGNEAADKALKRACAELWAMWNYRSKMALRPKYTAILGDCLTELVEDLDRGWVMPRIVWPGYVTDIELDLAGNVKRYTLEYWVEIAESYRYGVRTHADKYKFRKEVDGEATRYFKNDEPFVQLAPGGVAENPFGFVPAIWDRFEEAWGVRGISAIERTMQQSIELNAFISHAWDYSEKMMAAPIGVIGNKAKSRAERAAAWRAKAEEDPEAAAAELAESMELMPMTEKGSFVTVKPDLGQAVDIIKLVMDSILAENPESRYGQDILQMTQVSAPGIERALGTIGGRLKRARNSLDPNTVKKHQMAIAMIGERLRRGDYPQEIRTARAARYKVFEPYDIDSYGQGLLDFTIPDREWIPETIDERIARLVIIESLQSRYALERAGLDKTDVDKLLAEREAKQAEVEAQMAGFRSGGEQSDSGNTDDDSGTDETRVRESN